MDETGEKRRNKRNAVKYKGASEDDSPYEKLLRTIDLKRIGKVTMKKQKVQDDKSSAENDAEHKDVKRQNERLGREGNGCCEEDNGDDDDDDDVAVVDDNNDDGDDKDDDDDDDDGDDDDSDEVALENDDSEDEEASSSKNIADPFNVHFETDLSEETVDELKEGKVEKSQTLVPGFGHWELVTSTVKVPSYTSSEEMSNLANAKVKDKIIDRWSKVNNCEKMKGPFTQLQNLLFKHINSYQDVCYSMRDFENGEEIRKIYCLHAVNHIIKTRSRILKNNTKIVEKQKEKLEPPECRDQGLTRPKVLILVPFRDAALRVINLLIQLALPIDEKSQVIKKKRFYQEFKEANETDQSQRYMPSDFKAMFHGNTDDFFRVGITVMRKALKLYADFYSADIIVASPLGIRTIIGAEGDKKRDYDFLSSIEVLILDQTDVFLMQNWEHVLDIFDHLNIQPKQPRDTDFSRVRMWSLNSWSKLYRQTLIFGSFITPEMNSLYNRHCENYAGKVRVRHQSIPGSVGQIVSQIPQVFHKINCQSVEQEADIRFEYFITKVLPEFKSSLNKNTAIFIPSYFDFVRIRNHFKKEEINFLQINEYSERANISRARTKFFQSKSHFLLFTERFYFFYRYRIRGIRNIIFYQLPLYPVFYPEIINFMNTDSEISANSLCSVLYSKFDRNRLENIIGTQQCKQILMSQKSIHMIVAGN